GILGNFAASDDRRGALFEHLAICQIYHSAKAYGQNVRLSSYRTEHHAELDLIVEHASGEVWAVECKAGQNVGRSDLGGFKSFAAFYQKPHRKLIIYAGSVAKQIDDILVLPLPQALTAVLP